MPGTAVVYDTTTVVTAAPADDTPFIVCTIASVSVGQNFGRVRLNAAVNLTADTDAVTLLFQWYRNLIGASIAVGPAWEFDNVAGAQIYNVAAVDVPPAGVHNYNLYCTATEADSPSAVSAVVAFAIVGG